MPTPHCAGSTHGSAERTPVRRGFRHAASYRCARLPRHSIQCGSSRRSQASSSPARLRNSTRSRSSWASPAISPLIVTLRPPVRDRPWTTIGALMSSACAPRPLTAPQAPYPAGSGQCAPARIPSASRASAWSRSMARRRFPMGCGTRWAPDPSVLCRRSLTVCHGSLCGGAQPQPTQWNSYLVMPS